MKLKEITDQFVNSAGTQLLELPWENKEAYGQFLAQTYYFARETTRLLSLCAAHLSHENEALHDRFIDHSKEEQGHPEILLRDLKGLGKQIEDYPEYAETAGFYQMQYYWITFRNPIAFFGYILLLEGVAARVGSQLFERAASAHGRSSCTFLKVHAHEDVDHLESALNSLAGYDKRQLAGIEENFRHSAQLYMRILEKCSEPVAAKSLEATDRIALVGV